MSITWQPWIEDEQKHNSHKSYVYHSCIRHVLIKPNVWCDLYYTYIHTYSIYTYTERGTNATWWSIHRYYSMIVSLVVVNYFLYLSILFLPRFVHSMIRNCQMRFDNHSSNMLSFIPKRIQFANIFFLQLSHKSSV